MEKHKQVRDLRFDTFICSILQAVPGGPPPTKQSTAFEQQKDELAKKIKAAIAIEADKEK